MNLLVKAILGNTNLQESKKVCNELKSKLVQLSVIVNENSIKKYWKMEGCYELIIISSIENDDQKNEAIINEIADHIGSNWLKTFNSYILEPSMGGKPLLKSLIWASIELVH